MGAAYGVIVTILIEPRVIPHFLDQLTRLPFLNPYFEKSPIWAFLFSFIYQDKFSDIFLIFFDQFLVLIAKTI